MYLVFGRFGGVGGLSTRSGWSRSAMIPPESSRKMMFLKGQDGTPRRNQGKAAGFGPKSNRMTDH
jgi:hypothetical protein